jgi:hypothetical protein
LTQWVLSNLAGVYETPAIEVQYSGPSGKTYIEITGEGVAALLGDTLTNMEAARAIPEEYGDYDWMSHQQLQDVCQAMMDARVDDMHAILIGDRINDLSSKWGEQHIVEVEIDADKNPTGKVKVDGVLIENVRAYYS